MCLFGEKNSQCKQEYRILTILPASVHIHCCQRALRIKPFCNCIHLLIQRKLNLRASISLYGCEVPTVLCPQPSVTLPVYTVPPVCSLCDCVQGEALS